MQQIFNAIWSLISSLICFAIFFGIIGAVIAVYSYNQLQKLAQFVKESRSNIKVMIQKKAQLAQKLIEIAEKIAGHEKVVQLKISQDVTDSMTSLAKSYNQASNAISMVSGLAQKFPALMGHQGYIRLMNDLSVIEAELSEKREIYNAKCREYNTLRTSIPTVFCARFLGFAEAPYLEFNDSENQDKIGDFQTDDGAMLEKMVRQIGVATLNVTKDLGKRAGELSLDLAEKGKFLMNPKKYFYGEGGSHRGPFMLQELEEMLHSGKLTPKTWVIEEGQSQWVPLETVLGDASKGAGFPPPLPPPPQD